MWSETSPFLNGINEPLANEYVIDNVRVVGEIPKDLNGALYRNGSNQHFHPFNPNKHHWFDGDGMVHAFYISNGKASYRNKWVQTEGFAVERKAGRALYNGIYGQSDTPQPMLPGEAPQVKMTANVNVISLANRIYALQESGKHWYELVPETLDVRDTFDFGGQIHAPLTAHPHFDPKNGDMLFYVLDASNLLLDCCRATKDGKFVQRHTVKLDAAPWIHDFIFTDDYYVFFLGPIGWNTDFSRTVPLGKTSWTLDPDIGARILLVNRTDGSAHWFHDTSYQTNHYLNAYQDGTMVIIDGTMTVVSARSKDIIVGEFFPFPSTDAPNPFTPPQLWRWTVDTAKCTVKHERIGEFPGEFVRPNEAYLGSKHRFGYLAAIHEVRTGMPGFNCLVKHDYQTGKTRYQHLSKTSDMSPGEPIFVPRDGATEEDDGYLLTIWWDPGRNASELVIHAARDFDGEPLARVILDHRVPLGFHGNWVPQWTHNDARITGL